ncbi:unnamed protein product [Candidula unifasciata]|uniref:Cytoplasmic tRNA 2-thiolation protein 2 n=1 Tax=Candidula unifasciata TaxID=100452 RepID=A0A8S4ADA9_9EUPU|nr:unnamed protein product [Candidula unifasciata]
MCSIEDDGELRPVKNDSTQSLQEKKCVKCDQPGVVVTRIHDCFCKSCFQVYVIHKFRAAIGKSKLIREGERVLVAFSGGANSAALLHLIQDGLSDRAHRKLRFIPTVLHVDECGVLDVSSDARQELRQKIARVMLKSGFPAYIVDFEQAIDIERKNMGTQNGTDGVSSDSGCLVHDAKDGLSTPAVDASQTNKLRSLVGSVASLTSQEDFVRHLRNQLIVCIVRQMGFSKVLTAECSTRLSIKILTDIAQGRGSQLSLNTAFCDQRNGDVLFVRPVRDLTSKELVMYNTLFEVDSVFIPSITTKTAKDSSIERLTETFVTGLQADFSSTVANIVRTSEKLEPPDLENSQACVFCQSPLDTDVGKASALRAIEYSQRISRAGQNAKSANCHGDDTKCQDKAAGESNCQAPELARSLCYGCRVTLQNFNFEKSSLPNLVRQRSAAKNTSHLLREKISEFLLEDVDS